MDGLRHLIEDDSATGVFETVDPGVVTEVCKAGLARSSDPAVLRAHGLAFGEAFAEDYRLMMTGRARS